MRRAKFLPGLRDLSRRLNMVGASIHSLAGPRRSRRLAFCGALALLAACQGDLSTADGSPAAGTGASITPGSGGANLAGGSGGGLGSGGVLGSAGQDDLPPVAANCVDATDWDTGEAPLRRLTRTEYALTLQHLLRLNTVPDVSDVPDEAAKDGFTVHRELQTLSAQHLRGYLTVAEREVDLLLSVPLRRRAVLGCDPTQADCLSQAILHFGRLAFRRPLTLDEEDALVTVAQGETGDALAPYRLALTAILTSPNFLYLDELAADPAQAPTAQPISDYALASRLSLALVGRGPSAALLDQAAAGDLQTEAGRARVAQTLAEEAGFPAFYRAFFREWLGFDELITPKEPPPGWDDALLDDMQAETTDVVERFAFGGEPFFNVLTTDETVMTPALADFYGLPAPDASGALTIPADHPRAGAGLLGHAALLSKKSDGDPVALRGNWVRATFLCRNLHIPPEVAASFGERLVGLTRVQIVRERNTDGACRGCHAAIDPIGVGLDAFDATGRFDPTYVAPDYGIRPALPDALDGDFDSVAELSQKLQALPVVARCLTQRTFLFTHGREPRTEDGCAMAQAEQAFIDSGYDFRVLVDSLVTSPAFALRRAPEAPAEGVSP